ncbi:rcc01693 family protein [Nitratireductor basaltis]|uniref:Phage tail assembly chaperone n=1 Tax=Nitratireductor basaltis TaxID=472175 RepID=A0A084UCG1_9HYPH|nr:rcc01693 family protein [Nitratireductor basaltis]KFB10647.1 hypothetical protein EL18_01685 [Nitratireductor basaltis]
MEEGKRDKGLLPWRALMRFGMGVLRLPPDTFWALSLPELAVILAPFAGPTERPDRARLHELMRQFPDQMDKEKRDG